MRSRKYHTISKAELQSHAEVWLSTALRLEYQGYTCNTSILWKVLLFAAARLLSILAACEALAEAPSDQTIRNALVATLPEILVLEKRIQEALCNRIPKVVYRKQRQIAIDFTLIPYHGLPHENENEIRRSKPKSGTTHFHGYATAILLHKGCRYTVAVCYVHSDESRKDVVKKLIDMIRMKGFKIKYLLLDKEFCSFDVMKYLQRIGCGFIMPAQIRGRKPKNKPVTGLRAIQKKKNGRYSHTFEKKQKQRTYRIRMTICVSSKKYFDQKLQKSKYKKLMYVVYKVRGSTLKIREKYRKRFGIETSYRQMNQMKIRTSSRCPRFRLLIVGIALVLRNVWVWLNSELSEKSYQGQSRLMSVVVMMNGIAEAIQLDFQLRKFRELEPTFYQQLMSIPIRM